MHYPIFILTLLACGCLFSVITRLRVRQRNREKRLASSLGAAVRRIVSEEG